MITKLMNMAETAVANSGGMLPMFLTLNGKGDIIPDNPIASIRLGKMIIDAAKGKDRMILPLFKGNVAILMSEAWGMKQQAGDFKKALNGEIKVSESPEKEEIVIIHIQTRKEHTSAIGRIETKDGKKSIPEWTITRNCETGGVIPEILKKCVA